MTVAAAASGVAAFALAMAICRLGGGPVVAKLGERNVTLLGALLVVIGIATVVLSPWARLSPLGFAVMAIGSANIFPVIMGVAARLPGVAPSAGVATIGVGGVSGFLVGPPLIGFVAQAVGLELAFACLAVAGLIVAGATAAYPWPDPEPPPATEREH
jgi:predicted MFS family arabinose efflux permease